MYNVGDKVRCTGTVTKADGTAVDPDSVYSWFKNPAAVLTTYHYTVDTQLVKSSTGVYYMDIDVDTVGTWYYGFYSTGNGKAASNDGVLDVGSSRRQ